MLMNVWMGTCTTVRMSSTCASTLAARTSVNVNKICTLLMAIAQVINSIGNQLVKSEIRK